MRPTSKARKTGLFLFSVAVLLADVPAVRGQSALDGFDANANGMVRVVVVQPDGKILLVGDFTTLAPNGGMAVARSRIARLNPDGTLDAAFDPNANGSVFCIAVQPNGSILIGGLFTTLSPNGGGAVTRNHLARLNPDGTLDSAFDPNADASVYAIAVQTDGKILAGGFFTNIGGQARNFIARLEATTGLADSFNPNANGIVAAITVQADSRILLGGSFTSIGGQPRNHIARLDAGSGLADIFDPNASGAVFSIAIQADGKILVAGSFMRIDGQMRNRIARLNAVDGSPDSFNPIADNTVNSIVVQPDGKILVGGFFTTIGPSDRPAGKFGQARYYIARLDPTTGLPDSFAPTANQAVFAIAVQPDGKILAGGFFSTFAPNGGAMVTRNRIARLETDGRLDRTLNLNIGGPLTTLVFATAVQPDGKILLGGNFTSVLGVTRNRIARLNTDGTLDTTFNPNSISNVNSIAVQADGKILVGGDFNGANSIGGAMRNFIAGLDAVTGLADSFDPNPNTTVSAIAVQADGKILAIGPFSNIGGQTRNGFARLDPTTGLADSFDPNPSGSVSAIAVQADGKILAGGSFTSIGGQLRNGFARLDPTAGLADSFDPNPSNGVSAIAVQADGKILASGSFSSIGGQQRQFIARLDGLTGLADSFDPNPNERVRPIALQADGKVLVGGSFTNIGGQPRDYFARLDGVTGLADSFDPHVVSFSPFFTVETIAVQTDGKVVAGGGFTSIGGQTRNMFARLSNDTAALQNLSATPTTVIWARGGSSPGPTRVTFDYSTDNVNYTRLGNGTPAANNTWTLSGLNLPIGQNFYLRARGYHRSGRQSGSESITESVRNAFMGAAPTPTQVVSRKLHSGAPFDINLPLTGNSGIECRSGGATNDYQVVFTFANAVTFNSATITAAAGSVSGTSGSGTTTVTVNLTGVTNSQRIIVTLFDVNDGTSTGDLTVMMGVLVGDTNGDGFVNAGDALQTRNRSGQAIDPINFRSDVNVDGFVNSGDTTAVRSRSGTFLP